MTSAADKLNVELLQFIVELQVNDALRQERVAARAAKEKAAETTQTSTRDDRESHDVRGRGSWLRRLGKSLLNGLFSAPEAIPCRVEKGL